MPEIRIEAEPRVFIKPKAKSVNEMIQELSAQAEVVFFGLAIPEPGKQEEYARRLEEMAENFSTIFFVKNSSLFIGELLTPEEVQKPTEPAAPVPKTPAAGEQT